jgi:hypothetical protein
LWGWKRNVKSLEKFRRGSGTIAVLQDLPSIQLPVHVNKSQWISHIVVIPLLSWMKRENPWINCLRVFAKVINNLPQCRCSRKENSMWLWGGRKKEKYSGANTECINAKYLKSLSSFSTVDDANIHTICRAGWGREMASTAVNGRFMCGTCCFSLVCQPTELAVEGEKDSRLFQELNYWL